MTGLTTVKNEVARIDQHYDGVCKAIVKSSGYMVKDLSAHSVQQEHMKFSF